MPPPAPSFLTQFLGDLPRDESLLRLATAAAVIDTYRERFGIDDERSALGPQPTEPEQAAERERAVK